MKDKKVSGEKIALQDGDFFKTIPKFKWVNIYICIVYHFHALMQTHLTYMQPV